MSPVYHSASDEVLLLAGLDTPAGMLRPAALDGRLG